MHLSNHPWYLYTIQVLMLIRLISAKWLVSDHWMHTRTSQQINASIYSQLSNSGTRLSSQWFNYSWVSQEIVYPTFRNYLFSDEFSEKSIYLLFECQFFHFNAKSFEERSWREKGNFCLDPFVEGVVRVLKKGEMKRAMGIGCWRNVKGV